MLDGCLLSLLSDPGVTPERAFSRVTLEIAMSTLITAATVKSALRDARAADQQYDVSDSKIAGLQIRLRKETANWSVRARLRARQRRFDLGRLCEGNRDGYVIFPRRSSCT
jgi:hypothetical protein